MMTREFWLKLGESFPWSWANGRQMIAMGYVLPSVYVMRKALREGGLKKVHLIVCCLCFY